MPPSDDVLDTVKAGSGSSKDLSISDEAVPAYPKNRTYTSFGDRSFSAAGPRVWNDLPPELRQDISFGQFKRKLKSHLFGL